MTAPSDRPSPLPDEEPTVLTAEPPAADEPTPPASATTPAPTVPAAVEAPDDVADQTADDAPGQAADDAPAPPTRPRADAAALGVAVVLPLVGVVLTLAARTWLTVAFLMLAPAILVVYGLGLLVLVRALRRRSLLRRELGQVPRRYRVYAWLWSIAFLVAAISPTLGGLDLAWSLQAGIVGLSAVLVGIVTGSMWSTYQHDVAWVTGPRER